MAREGNQREGFMSRLTVVLRLVVTSTQLIAALALTLAIGGSASATTLIRDTSAECGMQ
jgi:hypothetical protein